MKKYKLGFLGAGKMGSSILNGVISSKIYKKEEILIYDTNEMIKNIFKDQGFTFSSDEIDLFKQSEIVILAIKPQMFNALKEKIKAEKFDCLVVSIAAGITISRLKEMFGNIKCIRVMPNTPALIGKATTVLTKDDLVNDDEFDVIEKIFQSIGVTSVITEDKMNEIIPLNGSMPAYLYYFAEAFIENGVKNGIDIETCKTLVVNSIIGSAEMILKANKPTGELIKDVCSPGGTTLAGLDVLKENDFKETIDKAADACIKRAYELANINK